ncbi:MAG: hypothetical protein KAV87_26950 [Desulfobacteraceae bacterium]|nr:hypothetical protein [Desulfobacteraceae bacterium]
MFEKLTELAKKDPLLFHKLGLMLGGIFGIVIGLVVSDRADQYEVEEIIEEVVNGTEKD